MREVTLYEGLENVGVGELAFTHCTSLTVVKLPLTVTEVGAWAFNGCTNFGEVFLNEGLQEIGDGYPGIFDHCSSLQCVKFLAISKRTKNLIEAGQTEVEDKITNYKCFELRGDEFFVSPEAVQNDNWAAVRTNLKEVLGWISHYELQKATKLFELAFCKARIETKPPDTDNRCRNNDPTLRSQLS